MGSLYQARHAIAIFMKIKPIIPGELYRSDRPTCQGDVYWLKHDYGIKTILNLQASNQNESQWWCYNAEVQQIEMGIVPILPPSKGLLNQLAFLLDSPRLRPLLVHCKEGKDRTGMAVAFWRMRSCGWTRDEAVKEMIANGNNLRFRWWTLFL